MAKNSKTKSPERGLWENADLAEKKEESVNPSVGAKLQISTSDKKVLTKNQQAFNRLTKQIEKLENEIVAEAQRLDRLTDLFSTEISEVEIETAQAQLDLALTFDSITEKKTFTKSQLKYIQETIVAMLDIAFCKLQPTPEQEAIYDKWSKSSYKEELARQETEEKNEFSSMFEELFGTLPLDDDGNPIDFEDFKKAFSGKSDTNNHKFKSKSAKQLKQEETLRVEQEIKNKSVRSIYISLAKILHPDAETDPELRHGKEQVMKQVTVAYEQKDLQTLLRLEMEWIHKTTDHLDQLSDDKLKSYVAVLKEQVAQLKNEKYAVRRNPRYQIIGELLFLTEKQAIKEISHHKQSCKESTAALKEVVNVILSTGSKTEVAKIAKDFIMTMKVMDNFGMDFDIDDFFY